MKFLYVSIVSSLITGVLCLVVDPYVNFSPQVAPQKSLDIYGSIPGNSHLEYCRGNGEGDLLKIRYATIKPNPPQTGQTISIDLVGQLLEKTQGAFVVVTLNFAFTEFFRTTIDLCADSGAKRVCPIEKGPVNLHIDPNIPTHIPIGHVILRARAYTYDHKQMFCLELNPTWAREIKSLILS
ncbi:Phosphatidylglycerol/phosphatidylinositol transfer protein [Golovinomyces cichoracearum]|uniref:Phosphatidylglycerol/phosphatidylinositol transfer protein n=1 Tax=Golovinomyces cichoracearum TaxID=62708 RepID=A0A420J7E9_9PEZI|nr:Phosphatidylglycerol/phosphatidylinositol transfer protein [Golovinomyces cichoracearum]